MKKQLQMLPPAVLIALLSLAPTIFAEGNSADSTPPPQARSLRIAAVQLEIGQSDLGSFADFQAHIEALVRGCVTFQPDLIVFPEYTSVFLALVPYHSLISASRSAAEGIASISAQDPLIEGFRDLFLLNSGLVERAMEAIFAALAKRYRVAIVAGTYFAWSRQDRGVALVNRAVVFDQDGAIAYTQDKVYLTPFEEQLLGISPGRLEQARPIVVEGKRIGITICRDTFFPAWLDVHSGVDLWIDIKANGTAFTQEERERFLRAVPARISEGDIPFGLTVCLNGSLLDLLWEGESSLVDMDPERKTRILSKASSASEEEILFLSIEEAAE